eukprot:CAMPEP_0115364644 /NCGR_PEP_ID=MMETSP0270-20121206/103875_1 /TAXON_ID=71861 /ORGANISM="Scrippsiella trochoidea, Strain CCMP3099" /LENGTH=224 /DNA_ID=CAMNT_0002787349 /DNA_START=44 /DNA_END=719 /DNA_ORIENTATION=+
MAQPKTRHDRVELPPPPYAWISWLVLLSYIACAVEGAIVFCTYPWHLALSLQNFDAGPSVFADVKSGQFHLCCIYIIELLMAFGPGWCAMSPGWTRFELLVHHAPYVSAVCLAFFGGHAERWTAPMTLVLLTPANEGMFIAQSLGAPDWLAKEASVHLLALGVRDLGSTQEFRFPLADGSRLSPERHGRSGDLGWQLLPLDVAADVCQEVEENSHPMMRAATPS